MTKTVALSDEAYDLLAQTKSDDESFTQVVMRLASPKKRSILEFAGIWKDDKETARIYKHVLLQRHRYKAQEVRL